MGIFVDKSKVAVDSFCKDFYNHVFQDLTYNSYNAFYQQLTDLDSSFLQFDRTLFSLEMTAMNLELFALAFLKRFRNFKKAVQNSIFTYGYLKDINRSDIWKAMGEYGIVLAKTATMNADGQQMTGSTGAEQMAIRWVDKVRFDLFKKWYIDNHNPKEEVTMRCVAHVANLIGADILANNQVGNKVLVVSFFLRIGADKIFGENWIPGESVLSSIALQPISMYDNATHLLKTIDLQFP